MRNIAEINLKNIERNARAVVNAIPKSTKFCAVVKADAYGHGAPEVAAALYKYADYFAVAITEEAEELRISGIDKDILILCPVAEEDAEKVLRYGLTAAVCNVEEMKVLWHEARRQNKTARVHIAFDSGMRRIGAETIEEVVEMLEFSKRHKNVKVTGFFSHFAKPENDRSRKKALDKFLLANKVVKGYNNKIISHISASGGFLKGVYMDMVRIGILLYGYKPFKTDKISVKPAMKIYSREVAEKRVAPFSSALYGDKKTLTAKSLSIVRYGYADGLPRENVKGLFNNKCMDLCAVVKQKKGGAKANAYSGGSGNGFAEKFGKTHGGRNGDCRALCDGGYGSAGGRKGMRTRKRAVMTDAEATAKKHKTISYEILVRAGLRAEKKYLR